MKKYNFPVEGMTCASCVTRVEKIIGKFETVKNVSVNLANESVTFEADENLDLNSVAKEIEDYGYKLKIENESATSKNFDTQDITIKDEYFELLKKDFTLALIITIPVFLISMLKDFHFFHLIWPFNINYTNNILLILTTPIIFISGKRFYSTFWKNLKHLSFEMNSLVAIGTASAYGYSVFVTLFPNEISNHGQLHVYYETAAVIITLILFGKILEHRSKRKTNEAIKKLIELKPKVTTIIVDGIEKQISINELKLGDVVKIKPGESIPADGIVISGETTINESMISGESIPVDKKINSKVIGGTINLTGSFQFRVTATGDNSILGQIIKLVETAQASKPPIQKLVDKVASIFVPAVMIIAIITFLFWMILGSENAFTNALTNFIAVLIVACPCALGLATPTAIIVSTGLAAQNGILIRNGESLEVAQKISTIIFDKTGTLTEGNPIVKNIFNYDYDVNELLKLVASLEKNSEHPIAKAIVKYAQEKNIEMLQPDYFKNLSGFGIVGSVENKNLVIGNLNLMKEFSIKLNLDKTTNEFNDENSNSVIYVAIENDLKGIIQIEDKIKDSSLEAINKLKNLQIKTVMITGDNKNSAQKIANEINIDEFKAEVLPDQKSEIVKQYQSKNEIVAMVGDGINDSPALAQADISFAIGTGTDIAIESSQITLVSGNLKLIPKAIKLSKITLNIIKQNLFWAFFYNVILIPLAAFGKLNPMIAALAMSLSSVSVVTNSLRIKTKKL
ncbi:heavy metal translocating P-type ATPase [Stygiobacter electus]|uniref:Heavy metal translocating P-type ATPase n=1 Tax=Stygiobacter electus TaxID=3032292 RepID=A0AAE3TCW4_9BACT|nr:heavy metal translocating P-type ATPase [Stygiobacter electus]MDF1610862.1 heavy metal translocating P-type ATPase [Stygiobacter electus]